MSCRVLHVIPAVAPRYGGPSAAVYGMCLALRARGVDARVVTTDADGSGRLDVPLGEWVDRERVPTLFFRRRGGEAAKLGVGLGRWLRQHVADHDVVHAHAVFSHAPMAAARACRRAGVPYIVRPLGTLDPWSLAQKPLRKWLALRLGVARMLRSAAAIHYTSPGERRLAEEALGLRRGAVIPLGVDPDLERHAREGAHELPPQLAQARFVLALGRLHPKKGLEQLIEAFLACAQRGERLALAGDGEPGHVAALRRAAARASERVVFTGWLSGRVKAATLARAAVLAMPSHQENFGLAAAEAMTLGVPVVVSRGVNLADEVEAEGAGWVAGDEPGALARALQTALEDEGERQARGARARRLAERFTWAQAAADLEALYRGVASPGA